MTAVFRLGITALLAIFLISAMTVYLARPSSTGLFAEQHGDCTTIVGGVRSYRYCGPGVQVVHPEVSFKNGPGSFYQPKGSQQNQPFDGGGWTGWHQSPPKNWPTHVSGPVASESLNEEQFSTERSSASKHLFDDPYAGTPWEQKKTP